MNDLTIEDCWFILDSLKHTKHAFQNYSGYPSYEFKQERLAEVNAVMDKIRAMRDQLKAKGTG